MAPTLMLYAAMEMCHTVHYLLTFSHISNVGEHTYQPQPLLPLYIPPNPAATLSTPHQPSLLRAFKLSSRRSHLL